MADDDRRTIEAWAARTAAATHAPARILDAGCGPGHWTAHLVEHGHDADGIDPVPRFVEIARRAHPTVRYRTAAFADLAAGGLLHDDAQTAPPYDGILAWYSLIHTAPEAVPTTLRLLRSALRPGGRLLVGFFAGPDLEPFDHAVTRAYYWPVRLMADALTAAGFTVEQSDERHDDGSRPHAALHARAR
jgi:SAM-dependent methyltransferase